jgi:hypothetical protein
MSAATRHTVGVEELIGVKVRARNGQVVGHIEEVEAERTEGAWLVTAFLLGQGALRERLSIARRLARDKPTIVVRWDQIDLSRPDRPVLTCPTSELRTRE